MVNGQLPDSLGFSAGVNTINFPDARRKTPEQRQFVAAMPIVFYFRLTNFVSQVHNGRSGG